MCNGSIHWAYIQIDQCFFHQLGCKSIFTCTSRACNASNKALATVVCLCVVWAPVCLPVSMCMLGLLLYFYTALHWRMHTVCTVRYLILVAWLVCYGIRSSGKLLECSPQAWHSTSVCCNMWDWIRTYITKQNERPRYFEILSNILARQAYFNGEQKFR